MKFFRNSNKMGDTGTKFLVDGLSNLKNLKVIVLNFYKYYQ